MDYINNQGIEYGVELDVEASDVTKGASIMNNEGNGWGYP